MDLTAAVIAGRVILLLAIGLLVLVAVRRRDVIAGEARAILYAPGSPLLLGLFRITVFSFIATSGGILREAAIYADFPPELVVPPFGVAWLIPWVPLDRDTIALASAVLRVSATCAAIGLATRSAMIVTTGCALYVFGVPQLFGKVNHYHHLIWFAALLSASPAGNALSIDSVIVRFTRGTPLVPLGTAAHGAPLRVAALLLGVLYFFAGFYKLWLIGFDWILGNNLAVIMHDKWFQLGGWTPSLRIDRSYEAMTFLSAGAILFELSFLPLAFFQATRRWLIPIGVAFHAGIAYAMQISFSSLQASYISLLQGNHVRSVDERTPSAAFCAVAGILLVGNWVAGMAMLERGWPFACYPTFAGRGFPLSPVVRVSAATAAGQVAELELGRGSRTFGLGGERVVALLNRISTEADRDRQKQMLAALTETLWRKGEIPAVTTEVSLTREWHPNHPDLSESDKPPLPRQVLARVTRAEGKWMAQ